MIFTCIKILYLFKDRSNPFKVITFYILIDVLKECGYFMLPEDSYIILIRRRDDYNISFNINYDHYYCYDCDKYHSW